MPVVSGFLACAYPVARYIDHVIHWRAQFFFMLGFSSHFLCFSLVFSSLSAVLLCFRQLLKAFWVCFLEGLSSNMPRNTLNRISALLDPHNPTSSTSGESAPSTMSVSILLSSFASALSLPSSVSISAETLSQAISQALSAVIPQMLVAIWKNGVTISSSSTSGNSGVASSTINVPST